MLSIKTVFERYPFKWRLWSYIEGCLSLYVRTNRKRTLERERWHLREFHSESKIRFLANIIKKKYKNNVRVDITSTWIDQYPKAIFKTAKNQPEKIVELADILLVVSRSNFHGTLFHRAAILLQAKCSDFCSSLDNTSDISTNLERDLIELCEWPIEVKSGARGSYINASKKGYTLTNHNGFLGHAAYLLIPNTRDNNDLPYNLLLPSSRTNQNGKSEHFSKVVHDMMHSKNKLVYGEDLSNPKSEWSLLVEDLIRYAKSKGSLNRFTTASNYRKTPISKVINIIQKIGLEKFCFIWSFYKFSIIPDQPPNHLIVNMDEGHRGFCVVEISISSESDEFQFVEDNN